LLVVVAVVSQGAVALSSAPWRRMAPLARSGAFLASPLVSLPANAADSIPRTDELLVGSAAAFSVLVLVEAGLAPVNTSTESELLNFQEDEATSPATAAAFVLLRGYKRAISPNLPKNCRFLPTCSEYAALAIKDFGLSRGFLLTAWRIARCNPLGSTGYDPPQWPPPAFNAPS